MPYSERYVYTRILGTLGNNAAGVEQWGVGFKIPQAGDVSPAQLAEYLSDIAPTVATFHALSSLKVGFQVYLKELTAAHVGVDGKYVGGGAQATTHHAYATPVAGGGSNADMPYSTAMVISLRTALTRGRGSNGRIYYPLLGQVITSVSGTWTAALALEWAQKSRDLLDNINAQAAINFGGSPGVAVMSNLGSGTTAKVTSVRCGVKPDSQERRERAIEEAYQVAALATMREQVEADSHKPIR